MAAVLIGTVVLGTCVNFATEKVLSLAGSKVNIIFGFSKDLEKLRQSVEMIHAVLYDSEKKQSQDEAVDLWLRKLEKVAHEAYPLLDEYQEIIVMEKFRHCCKGKVYSFFFLPRDFLTVYSRIKMTTKVQDIIKKLQDINKQADEFGLQYRMMTEPQVSTAGATVNDHETGDSAVAPYVVERLADVLITQSEYLFPQVYIANPDFI